MNAPTNHEQPSGFLLVDKPPGITSFGVIGKLRRITGIRKIGHTGTLDPFATGLLLVAVSRSATKQIHGMMKQDKTYLAEIVLGATTETLDTETESVLDPNRRPLEKSEILEAIKKLTGEIEQVPPHFAAIKIDGKKMYDLARQGQKIDAPPRPITVHSFNLTEDPIKHDDGTTTITVEISVSSGTYIRAIARDLGKLLGTTGYLTALRRTKIEKYTVENAIHLDDLNADNWQQHLQELA